MRYELNDAALRRDFASYWEQTIQGRTLHAVYCPVKYPEHWRFFDDAIVLRTDHVDIALLTDAAGGRGAIGQFSQVPDEMTQFWFTPAHRFREWPLEGITGHVLGPISIGMHSPFEGYTYCHQIAVAVDQLWLSCRDVTDCMYVEVLPNTAVYKAYFTNFIRALHTDGR